MLDRRCRPIAVLCLALLIALSPSIPAFAMAPLMAFLETPDHTASKVASPAGEATAVSKRTHQHGDESLAGSGGTSDCSTLQSIDLCMAVCCVAILSQFLDPDRLPLFRATESVLTIPSSASRLASHPPPEAIA